MIVYLVLIEDYVKINTQMFFPWTQRFWSSQIKILVLVDPQFVLIILVIFLYYLRKNS